MWNAITGIVAEIKRRESVDATMAAVAMAYVCIDTMAFLSMPSGQTSRTRADFIAWVNAHLKGHSSQPYKYDGTDVYAARCSVFHAFGSEAEMHRKDNTIRKFGCHDGELHGDVLVGLGDMTDLTGGIAAGFTDANGGGPIDSLKSS